MAYTVNSFTDTAEVQIHYHQWDIPSPRAIVQIMHGMMEHAARYDRLARFLNDHGFLVVACDHRGHGLTAKGQEDLGYLAPKRGWELVLENNFQLYLIIRQVHPELPYFLFGHSFGSLLARDFITLHGKFMKGIILSGTMQQPKILLRIALMLVKGMLLTRDDHFRSKLMIKIGYGSYGKYFKSRRTDFDWLSRDESQVDKYLADPKCGFASTLSFYNDFFKGNLNIQNHNRLRKIPKDLPVFIFGGDEDPVGRQGKDIQLVADQYKELGIKDVTVKTYKGGRHEMLNEVNYQEVFEDILNWMEERT